VPIQEGQKKRKRRRRGRRRRHPRTPSGIQLSLRDPGVSILNIS
jgi:hypothetical protein